MTVAIEARPSRSLAPALVSFVILSLVLLVIFQSILTFLIPFVAENSDRSSPAWSVIHPIVDASDFIRNSGFLGPLIFGGLAAVSVVIYLKFLRRYGAIPAGILASFLALSPLILTTTALAIADALELQ